LVMISDGVSLVDFTVMTLIPCVLIQLNELS